MTDSRQRPPEDVSKDEREHEQSNGGVSSTRSHSPGIGGRPPNKTRSGAKDAPKNRTSSTEQEQREGVTADSDHGTGEKQTSIMPISDVATVERVIRRATKLQMARSGKSSADEQGLSDDDIIRIGEELGLDASNVRQAMLEVRAHRARPKKRTETGLSRRLFGTRYVRSSRPIEKPAAEVQRLLEGHLGDKECLAEVRRSPGNSVWVPATGLATKIQRGLNLGRRAYILSKAQELTLSVAALDEDSSLVTLTADIGNLRRERATGWSIGSTIIVTPAGAVILTLLGLPVELSILAGASGAGATAVSATRVAVRNQRVQMQAALDGLLERLAAGAPLEEPRGSFHERFLR